MSQDKYGKWFKGVENSKQLKDYYSKAKFFTWNDWALEELSKINFEPKAKDSQ